MVVRPDVIRARLKKLREMLAELKKIHSRGSAAYYDDPILQLAAERALQVALQCILDIGNHMIVELGLPLPKRNDEILETLGKANLIPRELVVRLKGLGGLRNILVHDYLSLDQQVLYEEHLQQLDDLRDFMKSIAAYLKNLPEQNPAKRKSRKSKRKKRS